LNLSDIFASIKSPYRQTNNVKILAAVGLPRERYSNFKVFLAYVMCPQVKILEGFFKIFS
jgi:hypothetical protein